MLRRPAIALSLVTLVLALPAAAEDLVRRVDVTTWKSVFGRIEARDQIPAETSDELAEFADLAAALPQAFSQLSSTLEQALADQVLSMDSMTDESDPAMAIGVARLLLEEARGLAVDLHKHLNAARNATAHIISQGVDDGQ